MTKAPALFLGHGSPMNAIEDTPFSRAWAALPQRFERPRAILCVSAHWVTDGARVMSNAHPRTIHDFRGFPPALHAVQYPAPGAPELAARIVQLLADEGVKLDSTWGFDHGAWSVLKWLYPAADMPILQLSLDARRTAAEHLALGRALRPLRDDNVMIVGSGNIVHNLRAFFSGDSSLQGVCKEFDDFILARIAAHDDDAVAGYAHHATAAIAAPDWDHFAPLLYILGAREDGEEASVFNRDVATGISMSSVGFGLSSTDQLAA